MGSIYNFRKYLTVAITVADSEDSDEELAMLARRFKKFYKKNNKQRKFRSQKQKGEERANYLLWMQEARTHSTGMSSP